MIVELSEDKKFLVIKECTQEEYEQVVASYTKMVDGYRFNPLYKKGLWDGSIKFMKGGNIPSGTYYYLKETMKTYGYELKINGLKNLFDNEITIESFTEWVNDFFKDSKYTPRDYQIESAFKILKYKRCLSELATSAGKTLICFMVIAYLLDNKIINGKVLMIVPIVDLVMQSAGDFEDYSTDRLPLNIQEIYSGFKLRQHTNIMVGTYQSLVKLEPEFYKQFDCVITDECHKTPAASIKKVLEMCWDSDYRFGVSGTMPKKDSADYLTLQTYMGPLVTVVKAKDLQDRGFISKCKIIQMRLDYTDEVVKGHFYNSYNLLKKKNKTRECFELEKNYIIENDKRFDFVIELIRKTTKNTLVLFHRINYGKKIYETLKLSDDLPKRVYYIDGNTDKKIREEIRSRMETYDDVVLVASYQTFSTGISVNHIYNVIFTESFKSQFVVIQSIGRSLRLKDKENQEKNKATIIDLVDDLRFGKHYNYLYKHGIERIKQYKEQQYPYEIKKIKW